jgi:hypothetical protein
MAGFVKAMRSDEAAFLDANPLANHVLNVIARRARRSPCPLTGLQIGECFVGHKGLGLSEQQYRTVKKNLTKWGFAEFKKAGRATDRGTVAKLLDSKVYDINETDPNGRATEDQRKPNGRPTEGQRQTKNVIKKECKKQDSTPYQAVLDSYHERLPMLPRVNKLTDARKKKIKARWAEATKAGNDVTYFDRFFDHVAGANDFTLTSSWCNLEWLMKEANFVKMTEGNYHNE